MHHFGCRTDKTPNCLDTSLAAFYQPASTSCIKQVRFFLETSGSMRQLHVNCQSEYILATSGNMRQLQVNCQSEYILATSGNMRQLNVSHLSTHEGSHWNQSGYTTEWTPTHLDTSQTKRLYFKHLF